MFGIIGVIRGYGRELGVTTMLLLILFVIELLVEKAPTTLNRLLGIFAGTDPARLAAARGLLFTTLLIVITYISYEGDTLSFPGKRGNLLFDLGSGLLNGYLFIGSVWYYLDAAGWPLLHLTKPFTPVYDFLVKLLPPPVFQWQYLVGLAVVMLIMRVWK